MKKLVIPLVILLLGIQIVGCGTPVAPAPTEVPPAPTPTGVAPAPTPTEAPPPEPEVEQVLRIGVGITFSTLDAHASGLVTDQAVCAHIHSALFRYTPSGELRPDLCTDWEVSEDGRLYTFHLREGVQWHKGYGEFTAHDVKYSLERHLDPDSPSRYGSKYQRIDDIEVIDDYTVRVTLKETYVPFLHDLATKEGGLIVNQQAIEDFGEDYGRNPIGTGPFIFDHWTPRTEVVLVANPDYYEGRPTLDKLVFIPVPEATTTEMALEAGDIDLMEVTDPTAYERFAGDPDFTVRKVPSLMYCTLGINNQMEPFTDVRVRRALAHAIDKDEIIEYVLTDVASRADSVLPPSCFAHTSDVTIYEYDPDTARELLAEAGYPDGFEVTAQYPMGAGYGYFHKAMLAIQEDLAEVGVQMNIEPVDGPTWMGLGGRGELALSYCGAALPPDPGVALWPYFDQGADLAYIGYDVQELLEAGLREQDLDARGAIYEEIQQAIAEDVAVIPLFYPEAIIAMQNYVKGMEVDLFRFFWAYDTYIEAY